MYFQDNEPSTHCYGEQHKADFLHCWINTTVASRCISKMPKSAYHAPSHQMATPSASSAHRPSGGRARGGKALSMRSSVYSSQSSAALRSEERRVGKECRSR